MGEIPRVKNYYPFAIDHRLTEYKLPSHIGKVNRVFYEGKEIPWERAGSYITVQSFSEGERSLSLLLLQSITPLNGKRELQSTTLTTQPDAEDGWDHLPDLCLFCTNGSNAGQAQVVSHFELVNPSLAVVIPKRDFLYGYKDTDQFLLFHKHILVEYASSFAHYQEMAEDVIDDEDLFMVLEAGLRYHAELHTDEEAEFTKRAWSEYQRLARSWFNRHNREVKNNRRFMPTF